MGQRKTVLTSNTGSQTMIRTLILLSGALLLNLAAPSMIAPEKAEAAQYCDPQADWGCYARWCAEQGGTPYNNSSGVGCNLSRRSNPQQNQGQQANPRQNPDIDAARRERERAENERAERERRAQKEARRLEFFKDKQDALDSLKEIGAGGSRPSGTPRLKRSTGSNRVSTIKLKETTIPTPASVVELTQRKVDQADPAWVNEVQNASRTAILLRRSEIAARTRSFRMKEPPQPQLPLRLSQSEAGDIILVGPDNSSLLGAGLGLIQGLGEDWMFGNERGNVTHALVFLGVKDGKRLYLDNQFGEGPLIIEEAEFKRRYGHRDLYSAQPTLLPDGKELFKAAFAFAKANAEEWKREPGKNIYGIFGEDKVVCSEAALFSVIQAQAVKTGPGKVFTADYVGGKKMNPISVTPGDIYNQDGKGYFVVLPMKIDGRS